MIRRISFLTLLLLVFAANAQVFDTWNVQHFHEENGLSNTLVKSILVDQNGNAWIGTDDGVFLYDGFSMQHIKESLPNNYIKDLALVDGNVLICTDRGVASVHLDETNDNKVDLLFRSGMNEGDELLWYPKHVVYDGNGTTWITDNNAALQYGRGGIERYELPGVELPASFARATQVFLFEDQLFALSQRGQLYEFQGADNGFITKSFPEEIKSVHATLVHKGHLIVASDNQIHLLTRSGNGFEVIHSADADASCFYLDEDRILAGTWNSGLLSLSVKQDTIELKQELNVSTAINDIFKDHHQFWLATDEGCYVITEEPFVQLSSTQNSRLSYSAEENRWFDGDSICVFTTDSEIKSLEAAPYDDVLFGQRFSIGIKDGNAFTAFGNDGNDDVLFEGELPSNPQYTCFDAKPTF
ncbi:MAG: two-component regulator propeller domain-containing protein, partial [Bacteroidota bacterium]